MAARFHKDREDVVHSVDSQATWSSVSWTHCGAAFNEELAYEMRDGRPEVVTCRVCVAEVQRRLCSPQGKA